MAVNYKIALSTVSSLFFQGLKTSQWEAIAAGSCETSQNALEASIVNMQEVTLNYKGTLNCADGDMGCQVREPHHLKLFSLHVTSKHTKNVQ